LGFTDSVWLLSLDVATTAGWSEGQAAAPNICIFLVLPDDLYTLQLKFFTLEIDEINAVMVWGFGASAVIIGVQVSPGFSISLGYTVRQASRKPSLVIVRALVS